MKIKLLAACLIILMFSLTACSSKNERLITGKWSLASAMVGGAPSSFWFKRGGTVEAPWEKHKYAIKSKGTYEFIDEKHIKIQMDSGYYRDNVYYFDVVTLSDTELTLRNNYQDVHFKKVE